MTSHTASESSPEFIRRRDALIQLGVLDVPPDDTLMRILELACDALQAPKGVWSWYGPVGSVHPVQVGWTQPLADGVEAPGQSRLLAHGFWVVPDVQEDPDAQAHPWVQAHSVQFVAAVALTLPDGVHVGALYLMDQVSRGWTDREARLLTGFARMAMDHVLLRAAVQAATVRHAELEQRHGWLLESVSQDALTQVANRHALMQFLDKSLALARREHQPLSILLMDIHRFRQVNETFGDASGDRVLREAATRMAACARGSELVGRMAGDEFMAVLYPCTAEQAERAAHRYQQAITAHPVLLGATGGQSVTLGLQTGIATADGVAWVSPDELYRVAAQALDTAKAAMPA